MTSKSYTQLSLEERSIIASMHRHGSGCSRISEELGRSPSTISRELKRNTVKGDYLSKKADMKSYQRRYWVTKPVPRLGQMKCSVFWDYAEKHLKQKYPWSPDDIVNRFKLLHPDRDKYLCVSTPTFYTYLYHRRPDLCRKLLSQREHRKKRPAKKTKRQLIPNRVWIDKRPAEIADKNNPGNWESDTLGSKKGETDTLLGSREKRSRYMKVKHIASRSPKNVTKCMRFFNRKKEMKSNTLDSGIEFRDHENFGMPTYFCHPYSSWEKGQIENGMKMLRKKYPKKSSLALRTKEAQKELQQFVKALNNTPMKCLGWKTPREVLYNLEPGI